MKCLVIAGGPSVREALEIVPADWPDVVISANEHGFKQDKFKVSRIVYVDKYSSRALMDSVLYYERFPAIVVHRDSFPHKHFGNDAGLVAIAYAIWAGFDPIIVAGVDCTRSRTKDAYFWQEGEHQLFFPPGARIRAEMFAAHYADKQIYRMPSMRRAWPSWPEFKP